MPGPSPLHQYVTRCTECGRPEGVVRSMFDRMMLQQYDQPGEFDEAEALPLRLARLYG